MKYRILIAKATERLCHPWEFSPLEVYNDNIPDAFKGYQKTISEGDRLEIGSTFKIQKNYNSSWSTVCIAGGNLVYCDALKFGRERRTIMIDIMITKLRWKTTLVLRNVWFELGAHRPAITHISGFFGSRVMTCTAASRTARLRKDSCFSSVALHRPPCSSCMFAGQSHCFCTMQMITSLVPSVAGSFGQNSCWQEFRQDKQADMSRPYGHSVYIFWWDGLLMVLVAGRKPLECDPEEFWFGTDWRLKAVGEKTPSEPVLRFMPS